MTYYRGFRVGFALLGAVAVLAAATPAFATKKENIELIEKHFATLGTVKYQAFAPLGGPEVGAAEIGGKLVVVSVDGRSIKSLISEPFSSTGNSADFCFMGEKGEHLLTYNATQFMDSQGQGHVRGDLLVRDLSQQGAAVKGKATSKAQSAKDGTIASDAKVDVTGSGSGPRVLFELRDAVDVGFKIGSWKFQDNFIWQPMRHFLNSGERLPRRSLYSRLMWDEVAKEYKLGHFLTPLPEAATVEAANTNNRAILFYRAGHLAEAAQLFSQATTQALTGQSVIAHNTGLVSIEMDDIAHQGRNLQGQAFDEALSLYWRGEYADALASLARRGDAVTEFDYALRGLALAQERRWPEVDETTEVLARKALSSGGRGKGFYADYLGELVSIALLQGPKMQEVAARYLKALEATDRNHPAYVRGIAALMQRTGKTTETQKVLENYISIAPDDADVADLRLMLFELYQDTGRPTATLIADAQRAPVLNIAGYVDLVDYYNLRAALGDVKFNGEFFEIKGPLEGLSLPENRPDSDYTDGVEDQQQSGVIKGEKSDFK